MKPPAARKPQFEGSERLIAGVLKLISAFNSNDGLRGRNELYGNLLFDNGVAGAQRDRTAGHTISGTGKQQSARQTNSAAQLQSATIVAREMNSGKRAMRSRGLSGGQTRSASLAAADADEAGARMIASRFACGNFAVGLRVGHAGLNLV